MGSTIIMLHARRTEDFTPVHDHARLPWRFFARLVTASRLRRR